MKKCLVILSGWGVEKFVWNQLIELLENDFEIFVIDWSNVLSLEGFKSKAIHLLKEKGIERFSLIGWSLGSLVGIDLAECYSSKIDDLILFNPTCKFVQDNLNKYNIGWHSKIVERMIFMLESYPERTLKNFSKNLFADKEVENGCFENYLKELDSLNKVYSVEALVLGLEYLMHKDLRESIRHIDIPVLIIHGEDDMICPIEAGKYISNNLKESKLVILKETGHMPFYIKPSKCYELIANYIKSKEGR